MPWGRSLASPGGAGVKGRPVRKESQDCCVLRHMEGAELRMGKFYMWLGARALTPYFPVMGSSPGSPLCSMVGT